MPLILLAEDEVDLNALVARQLGQEGYEVVQAFDGPAALAAVEARMPDLVILDWMMPGLDGIAVCRRIRERHVVPVLMLTARSEESDVILGLEVGADDYLTKPFRMRELLARVRAILRRKEMLDESRGLAGRDVVISAGVAVDPVARVATVDGHPIELTPKEFDLLALFVGNAGRAFSREYLLERIWRSDYEVTDRTIDTHVQRLRKKLGEESGAIRTVWGIGYKFQPVQHDASLA